MLPHIRFRHLALHFLHGKSEYKQHFFPVIMNNKCNVSCKKLYVRWNVTCFNFSFSANETLHLLFVVFVVANEHVKTLHGNILQFYLGHMVINAKFLTAHGRITIMYAKFSVKYTLTATLQLQGSCYLIQFINKGTIIRLLFFFKFRWLRWVTKDNNNNTITIE